MATGSRPIEVCQHTGEMYHDKWFVARGNGNKTRYLHPDYEWRRYAYFFDNQDKAEKAKLTVLERERETTAPPP